MLSTSNAKLCIEGIEVVFLPFVMLKAHNQPRSNGRTLKFSLINNLSLALKQVAVLLQKSL